MESERKSFFFLTEFPRMIPLEMFIFMLLVITLRFLEYITIDVLPGKSTKVCFRIEALMAIWHIYFQSFSEPILPKLLYKSSLHKLFHGLLQQIYKEFFHEFHNKFMRNNECLSKFQVHSKIPGIIFEFNAPWILKFKTPLWF